MGVLLQDLACEDRYERCNWWNWRPTIEILRSAGLFSDERLGLPAATLLVPK